MASPSCTIALVALALILLRLRHNWRVILWLVDDDVVWQRHLRTHLALGVMCKHDLHPHAKNSLPHHHVTSCHADVVTLRLTRGDKVSIFELHDFCALRTELATDDDLAALSS